MLAEDDSVRRAAQIEATADAVLEGKQLLIDLDRRSNATREARNALRKQATKAAEAIGPSAVPLSLTAKPSVSAHGRPDDEQKRGVFLLCNGGTFVRFDRDTAMRRLEEDQRETIRSIDEARDALKDAVAELARLEGPDSALAKLNQGFNLKAV
jgi:hypothetical protein